MPSRPTLSVCILTWNSESRLPRLLAHVSSFADEIVVGVDEGSTDRTLELACQGADVIYRYEHTDLVDRARMLPLELASGDWILSLDDDERMDALFPRILPQLLIDTRYTHYWFPRKWIVGLQPMEYLAGAPWFPDWQLRLFRNDKKLLWHTGQVHTQYQVMGMGCYESRAALLHFERATMTEQQRVEKLARFRAAGSEGRCEEFYGPLEGHPRRKLETSSPPRRELGPLPERRRQILSGVHQVPGRASVPPWEAKLDVRMPEVLGQGERTFAEISALNMGRISWFPPLGAWPNLKISYHVRDASGQTRIWDGDRTPVERIVEPGESASFLASFTAPEDPGDYLVEWDLVSELECWFADCGSPTKAVPVRVVPVPKHTNESGSLHRDELHESMLSHNASKDQVWEGLRCDGMYLNPEEYQFIINCRRLYPFSWVVESGAGETSRLFRRLGCNVLCIEWQDGSWVKRATEAGATVKLISFDPESSEFDPDQLAFVLHGQRCDLIFVDSPVGTRNRSKILETFCRHLDPRFVLIHDAHRDAQNVYRWMQTFDLKVLEYLPSLRGLLLLTKRT